MKESVSKGTNSLEVIFNGIFWIIDQVPITSKPSNTRAAVNLNGANMFRPNLKKTPLPLQSNAKKQTKTMIIGVGVFGIGSFKDIVFLN